MDGAPALEDFVVPVVTVGRGLERVDVALASRRGEHPPLFVGALPCVIDLVPGTTPPPGGQAAPRGMSPTSIAADVAARAIVGQLAGPDDAVLLPSAVRPPARGPPA